MFKFSTKAGGSACTHPGDCTVKQGATSCYDCPDGSYFVAAAGVCTTCTLEGQFITPDFSLDPPAVYCGGGTRRYIGGAGGNRKAFDYVNELSDTEMMYFAFCP